jgi:serine/threonine protein kinase
LSEIVLFLVFSDELKEKSLGEIIVMAKLQSDHIVQYKSSWIENKGVLYIQMELCFNNLKEIIKQKQEYFNREQSKMMTQTEYFISNELFKEILECVNFLHNENIIHRDLKPENILITNGTNGRFVKLGDFGLAVFHEYDGQSHTRDRGTPEYTAPEVNYSRNYDKKSDIFSLAVIAQKLFDIDVHL